MRFITCSFCDLPSPAETMADAAKGSRAANLILVALLHLVILIPVQTWGRTAPGGRRLMPSMFDSALESAVLSSRENAFDQADDISEAPLGTIERYHSRTFQRTIIAATTASATAKIKVRILGSDVLKPKLSKRKVWVGDAAILTFGRGTPPYEVTIETGRIAYAKRLNQITFLLFGIVPGETAIMICDAKGIKDTVYFTVVPYPPGASSRDDR